MNVRNRQRIDRDNCIEVSADIDGFRLYYRSPKTYHVSATGDPFLAAALLPAMSRGEKLEVDPSMPVSPRLLDNIAELQEVFHSWNPRQLKKVHVSAKASPSVPLNMGVMSFFSGGVDSTYTFLKRAGEISHVVNIHGFDFSFGSVSGTSTVFAVDDIKDLGQLAWKLTARWDPVSAHLNRLLSKVTLQALSDYRISGADPRVAEAALIKDLNGIIAGQLIYETRRFARVNLRPQTRQLLANDPCALEIARLNRLLLEDTYPKEIAGKYSGTYETAVERNARFVQGFGKTLIGIETNFYGFGYRYNLSRNLTQGECLGSVALFLGFPRVYVPGWCSYKQLFPAGSHPLTDRLWSNECVEIIHDGCEAGRTDKLRLICGNEAALANLRVCFDDVNVNCGKCAKCIRTMIPVSLLRPTSSVFPPLPPLKDIRRVRIPDNIEMAFLNENLQLAVEVGDRKMEAALRHCMRRAKARQLARQLPRIVWGDRIYGAVRKRLRNIRVDTQIS